MKRLRLAKALKNSGEDVLTKNSRIAKKGLEICISTHDEIYSYVYPISRHPDTTH